MPEGGSCRARPPTPGAARHCQYPDFAAPRDFVYCSLAGRRRK